MARTITFQPTKGMDEFIEGLVQSGAYNNQSEVIRDALRLLQEKNASSKLEKLRRLIDEGLNSGPAEEWNAESFIREVKREIDG